MMDDDDVIRYYHYKLIAHKTVCNLSTKNHYKFVFYM